MCLLTVFICLLRVFYRNPRENTEYFGQTIGSFEPVSRCGKGVLNTGILATNVGGGSMSSIEVFASETREIAMIGSRAIARLTSK